MWEAQKKSGRRWIPKAAGFRTRLLLETWLSRNAKAGEKWRAMSPTGVYTYYDA